MGMVQKQLLTNCHRKVFYGNQYGTVPPCAATRARAAQHCSKDAKEYSGKPKESTSSSDQNIRGRHVEYLYLPAGKGMSSL